MKKIIPIITGLSVTLFVGFLVAHAQDYTPLAPLPLGPGGTELQTYTLSTYLAGGIKFLIAAGAGLAVVIAIIGGTQYVASGISPSAKNDAKDRILKAVIGLALVLTSYLILYSINPDLVNIKFDLPSVGGGIIPGPGPGQGPGPVPGCPQPLTPLTGDALAMENGQRVIFTSSDPGIQRNLTELQTQVNKFRQVSGNTITVASAYRPLAYQKHFYEIFTAWKTDGLETNTNPACAALKTTIGAEFSKHTLQGRVSRPSGCAVHTSGVGVDLTITGSYGKTADKNTVNAFFHSNNINLDWPKFDNDLVHFNLKNPPFTGCTP